MIYIIKLLSINDLEEVLKKNKISVVPRRKIKGLEDIDIFFKEHTPPFVIKGFSPQFSHKTEQGMVIKNVCSIEESKKHYSSLLQKAEEIYIEKQIQGREFYISYKKDTLYGDVISFGKGGIDIELYKDISFRLLPLNEKEIIEMIKSTNYGKYLIENKFRDVKYNIKNIIQLINLLYKIYKQQNYLELEINPLIVSNNGYWIVDVKALKIRKEN